MDGKKRRCNKERKTKKKKSLRLNKNCKGKQVKCKRTNTHIWIIVRSGDQVVDEGLQGPGHQVVVMVVEAGVALLLGLVQVLVVAAGVQLPGERRRLRHVVLQERDGGQTLSRDVVSDR